MSDPCHSDSGDPILHWAVQSNDLPLVARLIEENPARIHERNGDGDTLLHLACGEGHLEMAGFLLDQGADVNATDAGGWRPIHDAAACGHLDIVQLLVNEGVDPDCMTTHGLRPLDLLQPDRDAGHAAVFGWLMIHGVEFDLYHAVAWGMSQVVRAMLEARPSSWLDEPSAADALVKACGLYFLTSNPALVKKRRQVARDLLEHGANPNHITDSASPTSPLLMAIQTHDVELVKLLIDHGADVNMIADNCSPIQMAKR